MAQVPTAEAVAALPEGGKARRVFLVLRDEIANGTHGEMLPGEQRIAERFEVSRVTVRRALDALSAAGLIEKRVGAGSVIRPAGRTTAMAADVASLLPHLVEMGQRTTARLLSFSYGPAPMGVAEELNLPADARVQTAVRVRLADGQEFSHLTTHVPEEVAANYTEADLATTPLFRLLERSGVRIHAARQSVSATLAAPEVAEALGVPVGAPLMALRRVVEDADGHGVEHLSALYRPDMFRLDMTLNRVGDGAARHWQPVIADAPPEAAE